MQGDYGTIDSRAKFRSTLDQVLAQATLCSRRYPADTAIASILDELESMKRATANGRDPAPSERQGCVAGLIAVRELDATEDKDVAALAESIHPVVAFYEDWPTDAAAAAAGTPSP